MCVCVCVCVFRAGVMKVLRLQNSCCLWKSVLLLLEGFPVILKLGMLGARGGRLPSRRLLVMSGDIFDHHHWWRGKSYWYRLIEGRGQVECYKAKDSAPWHRIIWFKMSVMVRLRNYLVLKWGDLCCWIITFVCGSNRDFCPNTS